MTTDSDSNVLNKADALMRRHRAFVAGQPAAGAAADDLPVLTDVITGATVSPAPTFSVMPDAATLETLLRERLAAALPQQRETLRRELASWLDEQLPQLVMRVLDGVTDQLVAQINTQARMTLLPKLQAALEADAETPPAD